MSQKPTRTVVFVLSVLFVLCVLPAAPLQAKPARVAFTGTPAVTFLSGLWERVARLLGDLREKNGVLIDPDGATVTVPSPNGTTEEGTSIDPNGRS